MATSTIPGWSPNTDLLLSHVFLTLPSRQIDDYIAPSSGKPSGQILKGTAICRGLGGYDIIDHAFGYEFPSALFKELQSHGWVDNAINGGKGKLNPARTKMDVDLSSILSRGVNDFLENNGSGNIDASRSNRGSTGVRGDESVFIPRKDRADALKFSQRYPVLHHFISTIENTAIQRLGMKNGIRKRYGEGHVKYDIEEYSSTSFIFDTSLTSVQVAKFPGDGSAGYPRHCDRGKSCRSDPTHNEKGGMERILTFVYYLTPSDWDANSDGGALRLFSMRDDSNSDAEALVKESGSENFFDVIPYSDRMVVFRSDLIEHQVMPSFRRDRMAVTVWLYGKVFSSQSDATAINFTDFITNQTFTDQKDAPDEASSSPPPLVVSSNNFSEKTVFVAIPSYRDRETWPTIHSLIQTARYPGRIYIGVVWQVDTKSQQEMTTLTSGEDVVTSFDKSSHWENTKNLRSIILDYTQATGPCYARFLAQTLHRGEEYVLQIDSHMRFRPNWDEYLIAQLNKCGSSSENGKAVLTAYPPGYELPCGPGQDAETRGTILVPWKFGEDGLLRQKGRLLRREYTKSDSFGEHYNDNIPCLLYAGGFNFFHSSLLDVCPYDRKLHGLFFGEEISMAVRLFTHGYDLFAPPESVCYHLWKRNPLRKEDELGSIHLRNLALGKKGAISVVRDQIRGKGRGLGTIRSAEQFAQQLGVNFETLTFADGCENVNLDCDAFVSPFLDVSGDIASGMKLPKEDVSKVMALLMQYTGH